jgi:DNA-binding NtrC family response regulator
MQNITALLVHHKTQPFLMLKQALARLSVRVHTVGSYREAREAVAGAGTPHLVFTDTLLRDGNWADIVALAARAPAAANVIVVARVVDIHLYAEVLEAGAFDFIVSPFDSPGLEHVVRCAADNALAQREMAERQAQAPQKALFPSFPQPVSPAMAGPRTR